MPGLVVQIVGEEAVRNVLAKLPAKIAQAVTDELNATGLDITAEAKRRCPQGVGAGAGLQGSIRPRLTVSDSGTGVAVDVFTDKVYAAAIEFGLPPGMAFPPPGSLTDWLKSKGIPEGAEFAVARAIYERGTKPQPFLFPAFEQEAPKFQAHLAAAVKRAAESGE